MADIVQAFDVPAIVVPGNGRPRTVVDAITDGIRPMNHSQQGLDDPPVREHEEIRLGGQPLIYELVKQRDYEGMKGPVLPHRLSIGPMVARSLEFGQTSLDVQARFPE